MKCLQTLLWFGLPDSKFSENFMVSSIRIAKCKVFRFRSCGPNQFVWYWDVITINIIKEIVEEKQNGSSSDTFVGKLFSFRTQTHISSIRSAEYLRCKANFHFTLRWTHMFVSNLWNQIKQSGITIVVEFIKIQNIFPRCCSLLLTFFIPGN